jgi:hypothetical protein
MLDNCIYMLFTVESMSNFVSLKYVFKIVSKDIFMCV